MKPAHTNMAFVLLLTLLAGWALAAEPQFLPGLSEKSIGVFQGRGGRQYEQNEGTLCFAIKTADRFPQLWLATPGHDDIWVEHGPWQFGTIGVPGAAPQDNMRGDVPSYVLRRFRQQLSDGTSLAIDVNRLTPAIRIETNARALSLFGGLRQNVVSHVAFATSRGVRVAALNEGPVSLDEMSEPWLLVWFGDRSIYTPNMHWYGNPPRYLVVDIFWNVTEKRDRPWLIVPQRRLRECANGEKAFELRSTESLGTVALLPFSGARWVALDQTRAWADRLPDELAQRARALSAICLALPIGVKDQVAVDAAADRVIIRSEFTYAPGNNDWNAQPRLLAPLPPLLTVAMDRGFPAKVLVAGQPAPLVDVQVPTLLGPYKAVQDATGYDLVFEGLLRYMWNRSTPVIADSPAARQARAMLAAEIAKMCDAGHLRPLRNLSGEMRPRYYWTNPAETIWAVAEALPHLPEELRRRAGDYLAAEIRLNPPESVAAMDCSQGAAREYYPLPRDVEKGPGSRTSPVPLGNLYAVWLAAENGGDWQRVADNWSTIEGLFRRTQQTADWALCGPAMIGSADPQTDELNSRINGLIGYARMARRLGYEDEVRSAQELFVKLLAQRFASDWFIRYVYDAGLVMAPVSEWSRLRPSPRTSSPALFEDLRRISQFDKFTVLVHTFSQEGSRGWLPSMFPFLNLSPELAGFMADHLKEPTRAYMEACEYFWTGWFMTAAPQILGGENCFNPPGIAGPGFQAMARILTMPPEELLLRLDIPQARVGDIEYIRKLVAIIERAEGK